MRYLGKSDFFNERNSISDKLLFFGRQSLLVKLEDTLLKKQSVGIFGVRKSGKTSVMNQISSLLRLKSFPVINIDLQVFGEEAGIRNRIFKEIVCQLHKLLALSEDTDEAIDRFSSISPEEYTSENFVELFEKISASLTQNGFGMPVVILLDEMERIMPRPADSIEKVKEFNVIMGCLRALSQEKKILSMLVTDVYPDCNRVNQWPQKNISSNPVYKFFEEFYLAPFKEEQTVDMLQDIGNLMGLEVGELLAKDIHDKSGGHPYIARQIAHYMYDNLASEESLLATPMSEEDWAEMLIDFDEISNYFEKGILEHFSARNLDIETMILEKLSGLIEDSKGMQYDRLIVELSRGFSKRRSVEAVSHLSKLGLVKQTKSAEGRFLTLSIPILATWMVN